MRQQSTLARFGAGAALGDLYEILAEACRLVGGALGTDLAKVLELGGDGGSLLVRAGVGRKPNVVGALRLAPDEDSFAGHALQTGEPVILTDIRQ